MLALALPFGVTATALSLWKAWRTRKCKSLGDDATFLMWFYMALLGCGMCYGAINMLLQGYR